MSQRYTAFLSYSHAADGKLAPALQEGLRRFAKPFFRTRALEVFRDQTDLSLNPGLWSRIQASLADSAFFILLASRQAAGSKWVAQELDYWLNARARDRLLIVLTDGDIVWDDAARDFDWQRTDALPPHIRGAFAEEPLYLDFRWARTAEHLSLDYPRFRDAIADLAAPLHGVTKDSLIATDRRQHRRVLRATAATAIAFAGLALALFRSRQETIAERNEAVRQEHVARERLVRLNLANGTQLVDDKDVCGALPWFAEGLRLAQDDPGMAGGLRTRLATALQECPALSHAWFRRVGYGQLATEDRFLIAFREHGSGLVWDATNGRPQKPPAGRVTGSLVAAIAAADGLQLLTLDGAAATLWNAATGVALASLRHDGDVETAAFSADGSRIVTGGDDHTARIWDARSGAAIASFPHAAAVRQVLFSADGRKVVTATEDRKIHVWDVASGTSVTLKHDITPYHLEVSPDGALVLVVDMEDRDARLWSGTTGELVSGLGDWAWADLATFSPDGRWVALATRYGWLRLWGVSSVCEEWATRLRGAPVSLAFSRDGTRLVTGGTERAVEIWDARTGQPAAPPLWHEDTVAQAVFTPDGTRVATLTADDVVRLWELTPPVAPPLKLDGSVRSAAFARDGARVLTATDWVASVWDVGSGAPATPTVVLDGHAQIASAAFSPDGSQVATAGLDRIARVYDARTGALLHALPHDGRLSHCTYGHDGSRLATAAGSEAVVWDATSGERIATIRTPAPVVYVEFSRDDRHLLTVDFADTVRVWDLGTSRDVTALEHAETNRATYSPDGTRIATATVDGIVRVWDAATGAAVSPPIRQDEGHRVMGIAFGPDGTRLVTASEGRIARVWDATSGTAVTPPLAHDDRVMQAAFSPDGRSVVTASADHTVRLWDAQTGEPLTPPFHHDQAVRSATFSPDGRRVVSAGEDGTARMWNVAPAAQSSDELRALARALAARRVDETGALVPVTKAEFHAAWRSIHRGRRDGSGSR